MDFADNDIDCTNTHDSYKGHRHIPYSPARVAILGDHTYIWLLESDSSYYPITPFPSTRVMIFTTVLAEDSGTQTTGTLMGISKNRKLLVWFKLLAWLSANLILVTA